MIEQIENKAILVIGDIMLDVYIKGIVTRISPEAPIPILNKRSEKYALGGAANVAVNIVAANQTVSVMSVVGKDKNGDRLLKIMKDSQINCDLIKQVERKTTTKTRFLASNNQQVLRLDEEDTSALSDELTDELLQNLKNSIYNYDLVVLSDYMKGLLTCRFTQHIIDICREYNRPVLIDVKDPNFAKYKNATLLKPNLKELHDLTGLPIKNDDEIIAAANFLCRECNVEYVLCTCGSKGMVLVSKHQQPFFVKALAREVYDVSGAGDTTIAYLGVGMVNNLGIIRSVQLSNIAASIQVGKVGTSTVKLEEVKDFELCNDDGDICKKIINRDQLSLIRNVYKNKKIVFTNGCFDILHVGHERYLRQASTLGDLLIVGVNSDKSVKRLKGPSRPINTESDRMELLSTMSFIDYVVSFDEDTPYNIIKDLLPDVLVKGADYKLENVVGRDIVESRGGKVELIEYVQGKSTTNIINIIHGKD